VRSLDDIGDVMPAPFITLRPGMRLGLIPYGWSDGFPRAMPAGAAALVRCRRVSLIAPSHSELLRVDLTDVPDAEVGDEVVLLGRNGDAQITIDDLGAQWGLETSELAPVIGRTMRRVYLS
jgi:alanine racemase